MNSGIGPAEHLNSLDIDVIEDLPAVGKHIKDHLAFFGMPIETNNEAALNVNDIINPQQWRNYNRDGTGVFASIGSVEGIAFIRTDEATDSYPDVEILQSFGFFSSDAMLAFASSWGLDPIKTRQFMGQDVIENVMGLFPTLLKPKSEGYMLLKSKNPFEVPKFYGNYFTDSERKDVKTMIKAYKFVQNLTNTQAFQKVGARVSSAIVPGCEGLKDDAAIECGLRTFTSSFAHQVGSCRMGKSKSDSVTNSKGKVHGIDGLRIADLSIVPDVPRAHTYCVAVMVGEKLSTFIKNEYGL